MEKNKKTIIIAVVVVAVIVIVWAVASSRKVSQVPKQDTLSVTSTAVITPTYPIDIKNQQYTIDDRKILLHDGSAETTLENSSTISKTTLLDGPAFADIDGDNSKDAVVILRDEPGGSGLFYHVAVVLSNNGKTKVTNSVFLGDRIRIKSISIDKGIITIVILERKPSDPFATAPSVENNISLKVENGTLVKSE